MTPCCNYSSLSNSAATMHNNLVDERTDIPKTQTHETTDTTSKRISKSLQRERRSRDRDISAKSVLHFPSALSLSTSLSTSQQLHYQHQHHFDFDGDGDFDFDGDESEDDEIERHEGSDSTSDSDIDSDSDDDEFEFESSHEGNNVEMDGEILKLLELLEIEEGIREELSWAVSNNRIVDDNDDFIDDFIAHRNCEDIESEAEESRLDKDDGVGAVDPSEKDSEGEGESEQSEGQQLQRSTTTTTSSSSSLSRSHCQLTQDSINSGLSLHRFSTALYSLTIARPLYD